MAKKLLFASNINQISKASFALTYSQKMNGGMVVLNQDNQNKLRQATQLLGEALCILNQIEG